MSREFKVGDRVRLTGAYCDHPVGTEGTVIDAAPVSDVPHARIRLDDGSTTWPRASRLELVEAEPQFRKGDRVRVTFEAEYDEDFGTVGHKFLGGRTYVSNGVDNLDIVKLAEPFQPGDVVREKSTDRLFILGKDGYFQLTPTVGQFVEYEDGGAVSGIEGSFPSNDPDYVKVEVPLD